jgi:transposase
MRIMGVWTLVFVSTKEIVDTLTHSHQVGEPGRKRVWRTKAERRAIVEETLVPGASVSRVARKHDVNANQVFRWRKLYHEGRLGTTSNFLPVRVANEQRGEAVNGSGCIAQPGTMEIKLARGTLRIVGNVDVMALRTVIESLV